MKKQSIRFDYDERPERSIMAYRYDRMGCYAGFEQVEGERCGNGDVIYRLRVHTTMEEPPEVAAGQVAVFLEPTRTWVIVSDHRGEVWYDHNDEPKLIGRPGNPAEWGLRKERRIDAGRRDEDCQRCG